MTDFKLSYWDLGIIAAYFIFIIWRGLTYASQHKNAEEYFLAGRSLSWYFVGLSLFASNISSSSLIGLAGSGYETGFSVFSYEWMAAIVLIIFAVFFLPVYLRSKVYTMPEFLEKRYKSKAVRYYFSALTIIGNIGIDTAATLYAGALVIQMIFPGIELWESILALAIFSGLYTIAGGLKAVVYTDAIQAILLLFGSILISIIAFIKVGSWDNVTAVTSPAHFKIIQPMSDNFLPWPGLITGVFLLGFYFWANNQFIVQRALGAKNKLHGQWGAVFAGFLKLTVLFLMIYPGVFARVLYPDIEKANLVYPTLIFDLLPPILRGLVIAGLMAALMSSIDSALNSASTLITMDFYRNIKPHTSDKKLMGVGRVFTFIFMIISAAWAPEIDKFPTLWEYLQNALSYIAPPIASLFIVGMFWKRANSKGAIVSLAVGIFTSIMFLLFTSFGWFPHIHFLYVAGIIFLVCSVVNVVISLITGQTEDEVSSEYMWTVNMFTEESLQLKKISLLKNYRFQSAVLITIIIIMLIIYSF